MITTVLGLRLLGAFTDLNEASSLTYANDVTDIYSNSWGPCDEGCVDGPLRLTELALRTGAERVTSFIWFSSNIYSYYVYYCIAGNFHGLKLLRINKNVEFCKKTFADYQSGIWAGPYYTKIRG